MKQTIIAVVLFVAISVVTANSDNNRLDEYEEFPSRPVLRCVSGSDCGRNECSVMGMQRFSMPRCEARGGLGASCRPGQESDNKSLAFPHANMECEDVYMLLCPCGEGLVCQEGECQQAPRRRINKHSRQSTPNRYSLFPWADRRL